MSGKSDVSSSGQNPVASLLSMTAVVYWRVGSRDSMYSIISSHSAGSRVSMI